MSILTVFIPLAIALVLEMATFLSLEPLIDASLFEGSLTTGLLTTGHASHLLLLGHLSHLLLNVLLVLGQGHLLLRLLLGVKVVGVSTNGHGHKRRLDTTDWLVDHWCLELGLVSRLVLLLGLLLRLRFGCSLHY